MFDETISNIANIVLATGVIYFGFTALQTGAKGLKSLFMAIFLSGIVLGFAEVVDWLQIFPDGTFMADLVYEKEILVSILLIWGVLSVKKK